MNWPTLTGQEKGSFQQLTPYQLRIRQQTGLRAERASRGQWLKLQQMLGRSQEIAVTLERQRREVSGSQPGFR